MWQPAERRCGTRGQYRPCVRHAAAARGHREHTVTPLRGQAAQVATRRRYKKWSPHKHGESHRCHRPCHRHMPHQAAERHREHEPVAQPPQPGGEVASFKSKLSLKHWQELWPRPCQHKSITCPIQQALGASGFGGLHPPRGSRRDTARSCCELRDGDGTCLRSESRKQ